MVTELIWHSMTWYTVSSLCKAKNFFYSSRSLKIMWTVCSLLFSFVICTKGPHTYSSSFPHSPLLFLSHTYTQNTGEWIIKELNDKEIQKPTSVSMIEIDILHYFQSDWLLVITSKTQLWSSSSRRHLCCQVMALNCWVWELNVSFLKGAIKMLELPAWILWFTSNFTLEYRKKLRELENTCVTENKVRNSNM